jgi:MFS family permease
MALAGASWTLAASELWVIAQRAIPNSARGRISALMMVLSQGAMTIGGIVWGLTAEIAGSRPTLLAASLLFFITIIGWMLIFRSPPLAPNQTEAANVESLSGSPPRTGTY